MAGTGSLPGGNHDEVSDHMGIVEKCKNGIVSRVEGNSGEAIRF